MLTVSLLLWFCLFWIFFLRIFLFKNFQGCIAVYLSRFCCLLSRAATHTEYHEFFPLSITFLKFFDIFLPSGLCSRTVDFYNKTSFFHCQYLRIIFFIITNNKVPFPPNSNRYIIIYNAGFHDPLRFWCEPIYYQLPCRDIPAVAHRFHNILVSVHGRHF